jgi:WD40 repeat protein
MAEALGLAVNCLTVVDLAAKVAATLYTYAKEVAGARSEIGRMRDQVVRLADVVQSVHDLLERHGSGSGARELRTLQLISDGVFSTETMMNRLSRDLEVGRMRRFGLRAWKWPFNRQEVEGIAKSLEDCIRVLSQSLQIDQTSVLLDIDKRLLLDSLPRAEDAGYDSRVEDGNPTCHPQTRGTILSDIRQWADDPGSKNIFWLNGMAGTGKSTISRTLCSNFSQKGCLAASFFFKKGESNRGNCNRFFTTVAYQLALKESSFAAVLRGSLDREPDLMHKSLGEQWEKLIIEPLSLIPPSQRKSQTLVLVVDALDECDEDKDIRLLIHLFSGASWLPVPWRLKAFITSRPELPIRLGFGAVQGTFQDLILHEVSTEVVASDLYIFLQDEFDQIRGDYNASVPTHRQLPDTWPGSDSVRRIADMATPLFIFAATVCRFVSDRKGGSPMVQLQKFLSFQTRNQTSKLEAIYIPVLNEMISDMPERAREEVLADFHLIVGTIILLASPLSTGSLASLLGLQSGMVEDRLDHLHSVLSVPSGPDQPVRLLHLSFRDFLTDPKQKAGNPFWIDGQRAHRYIASRCISILGRQLCKDVRKVYGIAKSYRDNIRLPPEFRYACVSWIYHLTAANASVRDGDEVHKFLDQHFLHWVEAVCVLGPPFDIVAAWRTLGLLLDVSMLFLHLDCIKALTATFQASVTQQLSAFHSDAYRILSSNNHLIANYPMSVYNTMLMFTPVNSIIRKRYAHHIPNWVSVGYQVPTDWGALRMRFSWPGRDGLALSMYISPGNRYLAFILIGGQARVKDIVTGGTTIESPAAPGSPISFSHDAEYVAFNRDGQLVLFNPGTGQVIQRIQLSGLWCFSSDSPHLAVEMVPGDVQIREISASDKGFQFRPVQTISTKGLSKSCMKMTSDRLTIAMTYRNHSVEIWRAELSALGKHNSRQGTGKAALTCIARVTSPDTIYRSKYAEVILSPNSLYLAVVLPGSTLAYRVEIYRADTGEQTQVFESDNHLGEAVVFSADSRLVIRDSGLGTINIRKLDKSATTIGQVSRRWNSAITFSRDMGLLALSSDDSMQVWDLWNLSLGSSATDLTKLQLPTSQKLPSWIRISPDKSLVAVGMGQRPVKIWDAITGTCLCELVHTWSGVFGFFSDDLKVLAIVYMESVRLWSVPDGQQLGHFLTQDFANLVKRIEKRRTAASLNLVKDTLAISTAVINRNGDFRDIGLSDRGAFCGYRFVRGLVDYHPDSGYIITVADKRKHVFTIWRWVYREDGTVYWDSIAVCVKPTDFDWGPVGKISRHAEYAVLAYTTRKRLVVDVWSLDSRCSIKSFSCRAQESHVSHFEVYEGADMAFHCRCPAFTIIYRPFLGTQRMRVVAHVCRCGGGPEQVSFHASFATKSIDTSQDSSVKENALVLSQAHQPVEYDELNDMLAIATKTSEVLTLTLKEEFTE